MADGALRDKILEALDALARDADEALAKELESLPLDALEKRLRDEPLPQSAVRARAVAHRRVKN